MLLRGGSGFGDGNIMSLLMLLVLLFLVFGGVVEKFYYVKCLYKKSRIGCWNCKFRKVKCDEVKLLCCVCIVRNDWCVYLVIILIVIVVVGVCNCGVVNSSSLVVVVMIFVCWWVLVLV